MVAALTRRRQSLVADRHLAYPSYLATCVDSALADAAVRLRGFMRALHSDFAALRPSLHARWPHDTGAATELPVSRYLRGLTPVRLGLVLLICTALTVRQLSTCVFQLVCGIPDGQTL